jgi:hypothetical protein
VIRVYDEAGNVVDTHKHAGQFQRVVSQSCLAFRAKQKAAMRLVPKKAAIFQHSYV